MIFIITLEFWKRHIFGYLAFWILVYQGEYCVNEDGYDIFSKDCWGDAWLLKWWILIILSSSLFRSLSQGSNPKWVDSQAGVTPYLFSPKSGQGGQPHNTSVENSMHWARKGIYRHPNCELASLLRITVHTALFSVIFVTAKVKLFFCSSAQGIIPSFLALVGSCGHWLESHNFP